MLSKLLFGNLTLDAIPFHQPIIMGAGAFMAIGLLGVLFLITALKKWGYIWNEW
ncbi:MAG: hypothetical protein AB7F64_03325, partial [Gammaproteobacteria bacterium]